MKYIINIALDELEDKVNRQVLVDEDISLIDFCEFVIVAMNGNKIPIYELAVDKVTYYPYAAGDTKSERPLLNLKLQDLKLKKDDDFNLDYNFDELYYFNLHVDDYIESDEEINFKVLSGISDGIVEGKKMFHLKKVFNSRNYKYLTKQEIEYLQKKFDVDEVNRRVADYKIKREEQRKPKRYVFNVSLDGFNKEIKRRIVVNNNILIEDFCRMVIISMNGDLFHGFGMKIKKEFVSEWYKDLELFYLGLEVKQKLKIVYDWGDNWTFKLTLSKVIDGYEEIPFQVISGKGYGIIEDCGGVWGLENIFSGKDKSWGKYDINDFDVDECNNRLLLEIRSKDVSL